MSIRIGITGGIGSGKSYVCNLFAEKGIPVYNCDDEAKRLMRDSNIIRKKLIELLGNEAYFFDSSTGEWLLNKALIAKFLFANKENAEKINSIVHPVVKQDFLEWADRQTAEVVVQECAILFESGFEDTVHKTIEVYAPKDVRLQRAMTRDSASAEQIEARMAQQMPEEEKRAKADYCINNDGIADLGIQIDSLLELLNTLQKE